MLLPAKQYSTGYMCELESVKVPSSASVLNYLPGRIPVSFIMRCTLIRCSLCNLLLPFLTDLSPLGTTCRGGAPDATEGCGKDASGALYEHHTEQHRSEQSQRAVVLRTGQIRSGNPSESFNYLKYI